MRQKSYSSDSVEIFLSRVRKFFSDELNFSDKEISTIFSFLYDRLRRASFNEVYDYFSQNGIRKKWNEIFREKRSRCIAEWISFFVHGRVLDVLGGDGRIAEEMLNFTSKITFSERPENYPYRNLFDTAVPFVPFSDLNGINMKFDCVILCAVLHHEDDFQSLINTAARLTSNKLIIVENTIYEDCNDEVHDLFDYFFNEGLNKTPLSSPLHHKSVEDWINLLPSFDEIKLDFKNSVPGVPIPHHLISITL